MIYFIQPVDGGPIKIGRSNNCRARLAGLRSQHGVELKILAVVDEDQFSETALHRRFAVARLNGEWFSPTPDLIDFITRRGQAPPTEHAGRRDVVARMDRMLASKARFVASARSIPLADYLTELVGPGVERDFEKAVKTNGGPKS